MVAAMVSGRWKRKDERGSRVKEGWMLDIRTAVYAREPLARSLAGTTWTKSVARANRTRAIWLVARIRLVGKVESITRGELRGPKVVDARPPSDRGQCQSPVKRETRNWAKVLSWSLVEEGDHDLSWIRTDSLLELVHTFRTAHSGNECRVLSSHLLCVRVPCSVTVLCYLFRVFWPWKRKCSRGRRKVGIPDNWWDCLVVSGIVEARCERWMISLMACWMVVDAVRTVRLISSHNSVPDLRY